MVLQVSQVCDVAMLDKNYLRHGVSAWSIAFDLDRDECEQQDLQSARCTVPHWTTNACAESQPKV